MQQTVQAFKRSLVHPLISHIETQGTSCGCARSSAVLHHLKCPLHARHEKLGNATTLTPARGHGGAQYEEQQGRRAQGYPCTLPRQGCLQTRCQRRVWAKRAKCSANQGPQSLLRPHFSCLQPSHCQNVNRRWQPCRGG